MRTTLGRDKAPPVGEAFEVLFHLAGRLGDACRLERCVDVLRLVADYDLVADGRYRGRVPSQCKKAHDTLTVAGNVHFLERRRDA